MNKVGKVLHPENSVSKGPYVEIGELEMSWWQRPASGEDETRKIVKD